jgi:hypothetical protein
MSNANLSYEQWLSRLLLLAKEQDLEWLVSGETAGHRDAFDRGLSPEEELSALKDMAQWRGCGCGGG